MKDKELTFSEKMVVGMVIREAQRCLELDEDSGLFEDGSRFVLSLDQEDMETLTRAIKKI